MDWTSEPVSQSQLNVLHIRVALLMVSVQSSKTLTKTRWKNKRPWVVKAILSWKSHVRGVCNKSAMYWPRNRHKMRGRNRPRSSPTTETVAGLLTRVPNTCIEEKNLFDKCGGSRVSTYRRVKWDLSCLGQKSIQSGSKRKEGEATSRLTRSKSFWLELEQPRGQ